MAVVGGVDMSRHTGLRGICAIYIMVFHALAAHINTQGPSLMPLFFMLSGFVLAVVYGRRPTTYMTLRDLYTSKPKSSHGSSRSSSSSSSPLPPAIMDSSGQPVPNDQCQRFDCRSFYWNRFSRVLPTYYLGTLIEIPLVFAGYHADLRPEAFLPSFIISIIPIAPFFGNYFGNPLDCPGWFICTLLPYYFLFPYWLSHAQRRTDHQLVRRIVMWYWVQLILIVGIRSVLEPYTEW